ncbi:Detected protein of unknown function [Hibiscus syriacus]|uniref:Uncharacterized protein n=1 Tax=Hibiscus syriacus TaxID=106335 RepID=A0A6A2ZUE1_HIBSY|nr:Detected protein of unknown function [Hibiscus syriacus]
MVVGALNLPSQQFTFISMKLPPPWSRLSTAIFRYSFERPNGSNACRNSSCSIYCELDGQRLKPCHADNLVLRNLTANHKHNFLLKVITLNGEKNSSAYSWFIDKIPPTAIISSKQNYTNAKKITIDITFNEACTRHGGFKCLNSSNCDLPTGSTLEKHIWACCGYNGDDICKDRAGNNFMRSNSSTLIVHLNGGVEGVHGFQHSVINSTEQILNALDVNFGSLIPVNQRTHGNSRFAFSLKNIAPKTEIITVKLQAGLLIGRTGTPVSLLTHLHSSMPGIGLSTSSENFTKESNINVVVEFTSRFLVSRPHDRSVWRETHKADSTPAISTALHSFVTAGVLATTLAAATLSLSSTNLGAISSNTYVASDASKNLHGMIGHLQVFVLSDWLLADQPIEYSETTKRGEPLSLAMCKKLQNYKGWQDMEMNLFWLSTGVGSLLMLHLHVSFLKMEDRCCSSMDDFGSEIRAPPFNSRTALCISVCCICNKR